MVASPVTQNPDVLETLNERLSELLKQGDPDALRIGLLGRGIAASLSPVMHRREGERQGLDYHYHLIDFDQLALDDQDFADVIPAIEAAGFTGINVTHPFKQAVIPHLDVLSSEAQAIGAVNTVTFGRKGRTGHNTDCWGFAESFRRGLPNAARANVLQIGAGGAGLAVAHALLDLGVTTLLVHDLDLSRARTLANQMQRPGRTVSAVTDPAAALRNADGVVNASPIGMSKYPGVPIDPGAIAREQWVADIIYFPRETELLRRAGTRGCATLSGAGMAVFQAVKAFELFTERPASPDAMLRVFEAEA